MLPVESIGSSWFFLKKLAQSWWWCKLTAALWALQWLQALAASKQPSARCKPGRRWRTAEPTSLLPPALPAYGQGMVGPCTPYERRQLGWTCTCLARNPRPARVWAGVIGITDQVSLVSSLSPLMWDWGCPTNLKGSRGRESKMLASPLRPPLLTHENQLEIRLGFSPGVHERNFSFLSPLFCIFLPPVWWGLSVTSPHGL